MIVEPRILVVEDDAAVAVGALGALILALGKRQLKWSKPVSHAEDTEGTRQLSLFVSRLGG